MKPSIQQPGSVQADQEQMRRTSLVAAAVQESRQISKELQQKNIELATQMAEEERARRVLEESGLQDELEAREAQQISIETATELAEQERNRRVAAMKQVEEEAQLERARNQAIAVAASEQERARRMKLGDPSNFYLPPHHHGHPPHLPAFSSFGGLPLPPHSMQPYQQPPPSYGNTFYPHHQSPTYGYTPAFAPSDHPHHQHVVFHPHHQYVPQQHAHHHHGTQHDPFGNPYSPSPCVAPPLADALPPYTELYVHDDDGMDKDHRRRSNSSPDLEGAALGRNGSSGRDESPHDSSDEDILLTHDKNGVPLTKEQRRAAKTQRKERKMTREKEKRLKVNDKFDQLRQMLHLGRTTRVEKLTILTEAIKVMNELRAENTSLAATRRKNKKPRSMSYGAVPTHHYPSSAPVTPQQAESEPTTPTPSYRYGGGLGGEDTVALAPLPFQPDAHDMWSPTSGRKRGAHKRTLSCPSGDDFSPRSAHKGSMSFPSATDDDLVSPKPNYSTFGFGSLSMSSPKAFGFGLEKDLGGDSEPPQYNEAWGAGDRHTSFDQDDVDNFLATANTGNNVQGGIHQRDDFKLGATLGPFSMGAIALPPPVILTKSDVKLESNVDDKDEVPHGMTF